MKNLWLEKSIYISKIKVYEHCPEFAKWLWKLKI